MKTIRRGDRGDEVKVLQRALGMNQVDGIFGPLTEEAVKGFQRNAGLTVDGIVGPKTWMVLLGDDYGEIGETGLKLKKSKRFINLIVVHCSATKEGQNISVETIRQWHIKGRGWADIGYHYVVTLDGVVHAGRDVDQSGAHTAGHNANSIGVCYVGGLASDGKTPKDTRTEGQKESLRKLINELKKMYPQATVHGHREYANKACPCFDAKNEYN